jgi:hypothetical protein
VEEDAYSAIGRIAQVDVKPPSKGTIPATLEYNIQVFLPTVVVQC